MFGSLLLLLGLAAAAPDPPVLRVGMDTRQPPWSFAPGVDYAKEDFRQNPPALSAEKARALAGIDVEVAHALGRHLGATVKIVPWSWFDLEAGLLAGKFDLILSSWTPNPKTPPEIASSAPYLEWGLLIAARKEDSALQGYQDLDGRTLGHYRDPAVVRSLYAMRSTRLVPADSPEELFDALRAKRLDALVFDSPYVRWRVAGDPAFRVVGDPLNKLGYHVGVRRDDPTLLARVEKALQSMVSAGELAAIRKTWEGPTAPR